MKESNYNFFISDDNKHIYMIYNALKNTLVLDDDCKIKKFVSQCNGNIQFNPDSISEEDFNNLISLGIIVSDEVDEKQIAIDTHKKQLEKHHNKTNVLSLVITPTLQCNFKCYYCFESSKTKNNTENLSISVQNDIINFISMSITLNHIKEINITWYGGEPLIQQQIILPMQEKINNLSKLHGVKLHSDIITNGLLLTPKTGEILYEHGIRNAQITIDGPEAIHNKRRIYPEDPTNNYKTILNNLLNAHENIRFQIRINIDKANRDFIFSLIDDLINRKIWPDKKNVSLYIAKVRSNNKNIDLSEKEYAIFEEEIRFYLANKYNEITKTGKAKLRFRYPTLGGEIRCGYGRFKNSWVISYNGDLFRCWESVGCKDHVVGTVKDLLVDFGQSVFEKIKVNNLTFEQWGCFDCKCFPICAGGCPWEYLSERRCTVWKNTLEDRLVNQYKQLLANPEIFTNVPFQI